MDKYADYAASASVPTSERLGNSDTVFVGGSTNVSLLGTTTTTTTT